jgi:hypothetical protein
MAIEPIQADKGFWEKMGSYWRDNVTKNLKKISATFASMITTLFGLILYGIKSDLDVVTILITIVFAMQPFFNIWINIIFRGETDLLEKDIAFLNQQLIFQRDLSEYQLKVVALKASSDWDKANSILKELEKEGL